MLARGPGGLAAAGQPDALAREVRVDLLAGAEDVAPGALLVGLAGPRLVAEALDRHLELEARRGLARGAAHGGGELWARGVGERDVPLAAEEAAGAVEADPAGAGQVDLGPGVQVDDVHGDALGDVRDVALVRELDEVAADEAGGEAAGAEHGDEELGAVAAAPAALLERLLGREDAGLVADDVGDLARDGLVEADEVVDGEALEGDARDEVLQARGGVEVGAAEEGRELAGEGRVVGEGELAGVVVDEEVEGVHRADVEGRVHEEGELLDGALGREADARLAAAPGVLLPADGGVVGGDVQRVGEERRARVRRRAEAHDVRAEEGRRVVAVGGAVLDADLHGELSRRGEAGRVNRERGPGSIAEGGARGRSRRRARGLGAAACPACVEAISAR